MHLRSITMRGFKSFPHRTKLEFGTGVSVVVGPNGSGKSNITDAVLWALGEQSPLAGRRDRGSVRLRSRQGDALGRLAGQGRADRALAPARAAPPDRGGRGA